MRIGLVLEAFLDRTLEEVLDFLAASAPGVTDLEVGVGGFAPAPHCDARLLVRDASARRSWQQGIESRGFRVSALNVSGNPLHPDPERAVVHDRELRDAIRLAALLEVDRVVAMAGCPAGARGDRTPHFDAGGWLPYLAGVYEHQWREVVLPYWQEVTTLARAEHPGVVVCLELHPGSFAHNLETFERIGQLGDNVAANLDPSHLFWQQMDPLALAVRLSRIGHAHAKDVVFNRGELALNGLLDHRWSATDPEAPWTFATPGRGHDTAWWSDFLSALAARGVETISIEHEDPMMSAEEGVIQAARLIAEAPLSLPRV
ncbi:MAG TPA: sugar phosphate isomerase/epimerase [Gaiellaceae bacterium]|jgi:sugar phosphate isomerase/epimerase